MNTLNRTTKLRIKQMERKRTFIRSLMRLKFFEIKIIDVIIIAIGKAEISKPTSVNHKPKNDLDSSIKMKNSNRVIARKV